MKRKVLWTGLTALFMLVLSVLLIKLVDGMVQIGDDIPLLLILLAAVNAASGAVSVKLYQKGAARGKKEGSRAKGS